jgi:hypothetical protein
MLQHANVSIDNCSSKDIVGVTVVHKYCKNYTSQHEFGEVVIKNDLPLKKQTLLY